MLTLVRHGQSEGNVAGALLGRLDAPLTPLGERQARRTGRHLAELGFVPSAVWTSPLRRTRQSAEIIAAELGVSVDRVQDAPEIVELDYGEFDGTRIGDIDPADLARWRSDPAWRPPGGETLAELQARVEAWCEGLAGWSGGAEAGGGAASGDVLAVSHVSPIKACAIWGIRGEAEMSWRFSLSISTITRVSLTPRSLVTFGESGHLIGLD